MRFAGNVGFGVSTEVRQGVFKDVVTERSYFGDVTKNSRSANTEDKVNDEIGITNTVEIVADSYVSENIEAIVYVEWAGTKWKVPNVEIQGVRLILRLGGVYNGPTTATSPPDD